MFRRFKVTNEGLKAAQGAGELARSMWPHAFLNLGVRVPNDPRGRAAVAFKVFIIDYFLQNMWKPQLTDDEVRHFLNGVDAVFEKEEENMMNRLYEIMKELKQLWRDAPPQAAYEFCTGQWYLECAGIPDPNMSLAPTVGRFLIEQGCSAVKLAFPDR